MNKANFYKKVNNKIVQCTLCNHACKIEPGKVGLCGVRQNENGELVALNFGLPAAVNLDPIEKKPLYHFHPGSHTYSLGTLGCNFFCNNCQNWSMSQCKQTVKEMEKLNYVSPERIVEEAIGNDCKSISYTYNEPTIFTEYALKIMKLAHDNDIKNVWVSNGYMSAECLNEIMPYLDAINVDLKSIDPAFYLNNCSAKLGPILDNLITLKQNNIHLELTTLIIPSLSDDISMLRDLADFITSELDNDTPWHLSKFSPEISWKLQNLDPTGEDRIYEAYEIGKDAGLRYVYVGNIPGDQKENTYCPKCGELAIRRMGYHIERLDQGGRCIYCDRDLDIIE